MFKIKKALIILFLAATIGFFTTPVVKVLAAADVTELTISRDAAQAALAAGGTYESTSFAAFQTAIATLGGIASATAVIDDPLSYTQLQADTLRNALNSAISGLVTLTTFTAITNTYEDALAVSMTPYTPNSQNLYAAELARIKAILDEPTSGETIISGLSTDLSNADNLLVLLANKTTLTTLNNEAIVAYFEEKERYTSSSHEVFKTAVAAYGNYLSVNQVIADQNVSQAEVNGLSLTIQSALDQLVFRANVTLLQEAYSAAVAVDVSQSTPVSVLIYQAELERIRLILVGDDTSQALADQTVLETNFAGSLLVAKADKTALELAITKATDLKAEKYTSTSYFILSSLITLGQTVLQDENALQATVDQLVLDFATATENLIKKPQSLELTVGKEGINIESFVTLGNAEVVWYVSLNPNVATVDDSGNVTPLGFGTTSIIATLSNGVSETIPIFVKEKVTTTTLILIALIPVFAGGIAAAMILVKTRPVEIMRRVKTMVPIKKNRPDRKYD
jgi:hypothetical protein